MNATLLGLVLSSLSLQTPFLTRPFAGFGFVSVRATRLARFTKSFLFSRQDVAVAQSTFHFFIQRPVTVDSEAFTGKTYNKQLSERGAKTVVFTQCVFSGCSERREHGGALFTHECNLTLDRCTFSGNSAQFGGSLYVSDSRAIEVNRSLVTLSSAERFGAGYLDGHEPSNTLVLSECNITSNRADKWIGGLRLQHNGGRVRHCSFVGNAARVYGAVWDYAHTPASRTFSHTSFINNTADEAGAGITGFHILYKGTASHCVFRGNRNKSGQCGRSIFLFADNSEFTVSNCKFDGSQQEELMGFHPDSRFVQDHNKFNQILAENN